MKIKVKNRTSFLCPSVNYGNVTIEAAVELEKDIDEESFISVEVSSLQDRANTAIMESIEDQKREIEKLDSKAFRVNI